MIDRSKKGWDKTPVWVRVHVLADDPWELCVTPSPEQTSKSDRAHIGRKLVLEQLPPDAAGYSYIRLPLWKVERYDFEWAESRDDLASA